MHPPPYEVQVLRQLNHLSVFQKIYQVQFEKWNNRSLQEHAQFRTVICLIWEEKEYYFEGICRGHIAEQNSGTAGFGYDPIFIPEGASKSFATMTMEEKNTFSHRQKAVTQLFTFLQNIH